MLNQIVENEDIFSTIIMPSRKEKKSGFNIVLFSLSVCEGKLIEAEKHHLKEYYI